MQQLPCRSPVEKIDSRVKAPWFTSVGIHAQLKAEWRLHVRTLHSGKHHIVQPTSHRGPNLHPNIGVSRSGDNDAEFGLSGVAHTFDMGCVCVCVCVLVFVTYLGPFPALTLTVWGPTVLMGTKDRP